MTAMKQRSDAGAMFASEPWFIQNLDLRSDTQLEVTSLSSKRTASGKHFTRAETHPVAHTYVSIINYTCQSVKRGTYL